MGSVKIDIYRNQHEWELVNLSDIKAIKGLLKYRYRFDLLFDNFNYTYNINDTYVYLNNQKEEIICLYVWLDSAIYGCNLPEYKLNILNHYMSGYTELDISEIFKTTRQNINRILLNICKQIQNYCFFKFEDYIYLNFKKGNYKRCSKCGEFKLLNKFNKDSYKIDKLRSECKICQQKVKKY
ncbi:MAG: hypothetical protein ACM3O3_12875 [Syntrophothermus sp.]